MREKRKNKHKFGGAKVWKAAQVRKYFVNPKTENENFGQYLNYIIYSLDFRNIEAILRRCTSDRYFTMFTRKHLCWSLFLINVQVWRSATLLKREFKIGGLPWNLRNFSEHIFLQNTSGSCFWKYPMNFLIIVFENDDWCHFVVLIGSPALVSIYCVCFVFFYFFPLFLLFMDSTTLWFLRKACQCLK